MSRVFVLGVDGGTFDIVRPWALKGELPTFKKLIDSGISGDLESTIPPLTGPAWISFATGKNPGKHGCFDFMKRKKDSYEREPIKLKDFRKYSIWNLLSKANKRTCAINVPVTYPPQTVNGYIISGVMTPSMDSEFTYPHSLKQEIIDKFSGYRITAESTYQPGKEEDIIKELQNVTKNRTKLIKYMYEKEDFDFFMAVYGCSDFMSHWFWHHMDKNHPLHDPIKSKKWENAILEYYKLLDKQLNEILSILKKDTTFFIISDHGFGPYEKGVYINSWLIDKGYLKLKSNLSTKFKYFLHKKGLNLDNMYNLILKTGILNTSLFNKLGFSNAMSKESERARTKILKFLSFLFLLSFKDVDWKKTKAYSIGNYGQIYLNIKGREPEGIIKKENYNKVRNKLISDLKTIIDPKTNKHIDIEVLKKEEIYNGPHTENAPDLFFIMNNFKYIAARYFEFGSSKLFGPPHRNLSGCHRRNGMFLASNSNIKKGIKNASIIDITPTILHILKVPIPIDIDGKILTDIFLKDSKFNRKPVYEKSKDESSIIHKINI
ncbi:MAG: alkaline phosphatase family protein [Candidatus Woesearchaeota archaeon]|nr:MAG: alkaline phosphatase family protein [Candidatus Woesearchaeota archaeon]